MDILIKNARIIDGSGAASYMGNVGICRGKLVLSNLPAKADLVIDAAGKCLAPGFIDSHSHGDMVIGAPDYGDLCKVNQGVTTQIAGQCGDTTAPVVNGCSTSKLSSPEGLDPAVKAEEKNWSMWSIYADFVDRWPKVTNYKMFIGFNAIRIAVMGYEDRKPTEEELERMKALLRDAMEAGAVGMSSGLAYVPGTFATTDEIVEVAKVMAPYGGIYTSHIRNESWDLLRSVEEAIEIGRRAGVAVNISHFKVMGRAFWGTHRKAIEAIEKARAEGLQVTCDQYPYNCSMTIYAPCMPPWYFTDGMEAAAERLKDPQLRKQVEAEMLDPATDYENFFLNSGGWDGITVCTSPNVPEAEGLTISEYGRRIGKSAFDAYFDLMVANKGLGTAVYHSISDDDIADIIRLPYVMVGSDGLVNARSEKCHPRGWGTMVRAICAFTKDQKVLPLEELIHKMTGMPASVFSLGGKGLIKEGYDADLVLFDYENLTDRATYANPTELAEGITCVFVNGKIVYENGKLTGEKPGKLLRHGR